MSKNEIVNEPNAIIKTEYVNKSKLDKLLSSDQTPDRDRPILKAISRVLKGNKSYKVAYTYSNEYNLGRLYAIGPSAQKLTRISRDCLFNEICYDLDMVNCQFTILKKKCKENNWPFKMIDKYINNRDEYFERIINQYNCNESFPIDKSHAKNLFIRLLFGGSFNNWQIDNNISLEIPKLKSIEKFENEFNKISNFAWDQFVDLQEPCKSIAKKNKSNKKSTLLAMMLQHEENIILKETVAFLKSKGYDMCVLMFDGGLIKKDLNHDFLNDVNIINELENHLKNKLNYDITFKIKEMVNEFEDIKDYNLLPRGIDIDDDFAAKQLIKFIGRNRIVFTDEAIHIYDPISKLWTKKPNVLDRLIQNDFNKRLKFRQRDEYGKIKLFNFSGLLARKNCMIKYLPGNCGIEKFFTHSKIESGFGNLSFNDCMYNMDEGIPKDFDSNITLFAKIHRNFPARNQDKINEVHKIIFEDPYVDFDVAKRLKQEIALAIHGKYYEKKTFIECVGNSNTCKSVTVDIIKKAFEDYVGTWSTNDLVENSQESNDKKRLGFLIPIFKNRINLASEYKANRKLSPEILKMICSGGDTIEARQLYETDTKFKVYSKFFSFTNDILKFENANCDAVKKKIKGIVEFEVEFCDTPNPDNPQRSKKADPDIKSKINSDLDTSYADAFFWIIMDEYTEMKNNNNDFKMIVPSCFEDSESYDNDKNKSENYGKLYLQIFDRTNNNNDIVFISDIIERFDKLGKKHIDLTKLKIDIGNYAPGASILSGREYNAKKNPRTNKQERMYILGWKYNPDKFNELRNEVRNFYD